MSDKTRDILSEAFSWAKMLVGAFIFALLMNKFVIVNADVPSSSMEDTIRTNSRIVAFRPTYALVDPKRFDVVVFHYPDDEEVLYVKRVIGMPGETLEMRGGVVFVTDKDGVVTELTNEFTKEKPRGDYGPIDIPEGAYFMMGDNRNFSEDSRFWRNTFVYKEKMLGRVFFSYYPTFKTVGLTTAERLGLYAVAAAFAGVLLWLLLLSFLKAKVTIGLDGDHYTADPEKKLPDGTKVIASRLVKPRYGDLAMFPIRGNADMVVGEYTVEAWENGVKVFGKVTKIKLKKERQRNAKQTLKEEI